MEIPIVKIVSAAALISIRVSALMLFAPFFSGISIPTRVKAVLVLAITAVLYPVCSHQVATISPTTLPLLIGTELMLGVAIGLTTNIVFEAVQIAGQIISIQVGYSLVNILDPNTQVDSTAVSVFHQTIAMLIFLTLDIHHWILRAVANSFDYVPIGHVMVGPQFTESLLHDGAIVLGLSIQIAAPVLVATLLIDITLGLLGKASPQMPLMLLGPAVKSMVGVLLLGATIQYWPHLFENYFLQSLNYTERVLHLAH